MGTPFIGAEELILLGVTEATLPVRSALRKVGQSCCGQFGDGGAHHR